MQDTVKAAVQKAKAMAECNDPEEALSALEMALRLKPDTADKIELWKARDAIKANRIKQAFVILCDLLANEETRRTKKQSFARPPTFAIMPVIYYTLRGTVRPKDGGTFRTTLHPGTVQHIIFMRQGNPVGIALCRDIVHEPKNATWQMTYGDISWLETQ